MNPKTMDDLRNLKLKDAAVTLATGDSLTDDKLISSIRSIGKIPFVLDFSRDFNGNEAYKKEGTYYQSFSIDKILVSVAANTHHSIKDAKDTVGYFMLLYSLAVARAESMASSEILLPSAIFPINPDSMSGFAKALQRLTDEGTSKETNISLEFMLSDGRGNNHSNTSLSNDKTVTLISGGTDSVGVAYIEKGLGKTLSLVQILYDHAARYQEMWCVDKVVGDLGIKSADICRVHLPMVKTFGGSALLRDDIRIIEENKKIEYVPFRNTILLAVALMKAELAGAKYVAIGANHDDTMAPDGTPSYIESINNLMLAIGSETPRVIAPLLGFGGKPEAIRTGIDLGIDFSHTWSCHTYVPPEASGPDAKACGTCGNCSTRYSAFKHLGLDDPVKYMEMPTLRTKWAGPKENYMPLRKKLSIK